MSGPIVLVLRLLALAVLYAFLGAALWVMWQALRRGAEAARGSQVPTLRVDISQKAQRSATLSFTQAEVTIGREALSDIPLRDRSVSSRHARLSFHDGQWWLEDLGSKNGTRLNRERVLGATVLTSGDEIKIGSARLFVMLPAERDLRFEQSGADNE